MRALVAFVTAAFLLASLTTAANACAALPDCAHHTGQPAPTDSTTHHAHHAADTNPASVDAEHNCGSCDHCTGYLGAHFEGLNIVMACMHTGAPLVNIPAARPVHATDITSRPDLPPPRSASVLRLS